MKKYQPEKLAKLAADRFSEGISSGIIVDHFEFSKKNIITRIKNSIKTRHSLNLAEGFFVDFRRKDFPAQAAEFYQTLHKAVQRRDKVELMKRLSVPLYDLLKPGLKNPKELPFELYDQVLDAIIVQARVYKPPSINIANQTWHQVTLKFNIANKDGKDEIIRYPVFERRESDSSVQDWRICFLE